VNLVYSGYGAGLVKYGTCSANCASSGAWQTTVLGPLLGSSGAAIAAGSSGTRLVAIAGLGLSVWRCAASCESAGAWKSFQLDTLPYNTVFQNIESVSVALDSADQPLIARYGWGVVKYFRRTS